MGLGVTVHAEAYIYSGLRGFTISMFFYLPI
jgi:hypothetical protein